MRIIANLFIVLSYCAAQGCWDRAIANNLYIYISFLRSGALSGLMLDLGILKISLGVFVPISSPCGGL